MWKISIRNNDDVDAITFNVGKMKEAITIVGTLMDICSYTKDEVMITIKKAPDDMQSDEGKEDAPYAL